MPDRTPAGRLRHLLVAAFTEDRPTLQPRSAWAMVEKMLRTPAGKMLEREWIEGRQAQFLDDARDAYQYGGRARG